jgi:tetratricopeptide (TPR) repeat protein
MNFGFYNYLIEHYKYQPYNEEIYYNDLVRFHPRYYEKRGGYYNVNKRYLESYNDYKQYLGGVGKNDGDVWYKTSLLLCRLGYYSDASLCLENAKKFGLKFHYSPDIKEFEEALNSVLQKGSN